MSDFDAGEGRSSRRFLSRSYLLPWAAALAVAVFAVVLAVWYVPGQRSNPALQAAAQQNSGLTGAAKSSETKNDGAAVPASVQWRGSTSGIKKATAVAVDNPRAWVRLWGMHAPGKPVPKINFSRFMALAVFQGSESPERCCIKITGIIREADKIRVFYGFEEPPAQKGNGPFSSFNIKVIRRSAAPVVFTKKSGN